MDRFNRSESKEARDSFINNLLSVSSKERQFEEELEVITDGANNKA